MSTQCEAMMIRTVTLLGKDILASGMVQSTCFAQASYLGLNLKDLYFVELSLFCRQAPGAPAAELYLPGQIRALCLRRHHS
jgi:hypothetical protein